MSEVARSNEGMNVDVLEGCKGVGEKSDDFPTNGMERSTCASHGAR
jgi:hypothetical protein